MENTVVIYQGKYGATRQYAEWIAEELDCEIYPLDKFRRSTLPDYDNIIFGGALQAGAIKGFDLIQKNHMDFLIRRQKVVAFAVGISVDDPENRRQIRETNLTRKGLEGMNLYYCKGAFDPSSVKGAEKFIVNLSMKTLYKEKERWTEYQEQLYHDMSEGANYVDRKYIEPIVAEFKMQQIQLPEETDAQLSEAE